MAFDGSVNVDSKIDGSGFSDGLGKIGSAAKGALGGIATTIGGAAVALGTLAGAAIKTGSDFESQMSRVQAISGATGDDFDALNKQAIDLGASTVFSASQAAEGMENLASAGFSVKEIMSAMPGMLNLAASSGEDLATASDIAASTLRGFGLAASDAGHVADVLAKNAAETNAAVADTGEAMKYIAPIAKTAGWSLESVTAAIGEMANAGIKGSQAGTVLRSALTSLMNPSKNQADAMQAIGFSAYDANGHMKSLSQMISDLQKGTAGLTEEQRNQYIATIFGTEALSGMQVLLQQGSGNLDALTQSLVNSDGSAADMAATMNNNLKGAVQGLTGSLESLGIEFYQSIDNPLKDVVNKAAGYIKQLTDAFASGGIQGLVSTLGTVLSSAITSIAQQAPAMINLGVSLIQSFLTGIQQNAPQLATAALGIITSLVTGIINLFPQIISTGGELIIQFAQGLAGQLPQLLTQAGNAITTLVQGFISNLPTIISTAVQILLGFIQGLSQTLPQLIPLAISAVLTLVDTLINHIDEIINAGIQMLLALVQGVINSLPMLIEKVPVIINKLCAAIDNNLPLILAAGIQIIVMLAKGLIQSLPVILANLDQIILAIINIFLHLDMLSLGKGLITRLGSGIKGMFGSIKTYISDLGKVITTPFNSLTKSMGDIGGNLIKGLWNGIANVKNWILGKIGGFVDDIVGGIKSFFGIASPSKLFRDEIGKMLPPGIAIGFERATPSAVKDMQSQMDGMVAKMQSTVSVQQSRAGTYAGTRYVPQSTTGPKSSDSPTYNQTVNNYSPKALSPAEVARQTRNATRQFVLRTAR